MTGAAYLWVEGVDFANTLYDTNDLSTVRGASLALLGIGSHFADALKGTDTFQPEMVFNGASQAAFRLVGDVEMIASTVSRTFDQPLVGVLGHMSIVHGLAFVAADDENAALAMAQARARRAQQRQISVPGSVETTATRPCAFDRMRGAVEQVKVGSDSYPASTSVKARRDFGRKQRTEFYRPYLKSSHAFPDSFEALIAQPPENTPQSIRNKMAVIYLDGNGFRALRDSMKTAGSKPKDWLGRFSSGLQDLQTTRLLPKVVEAAGVNPSGVTPIEVLLWGGDEARFVVPAWRGLDLARAVMDEIRGWELSDRRLTFSVSMVFAHYKTPIRLLAAAGEDLVECLKAGQADAIKDGEPAWRNQIAFDVLESLDVPAQGLVAARRDSLKLTSDKMTAAFYALDGDAFDAALDSLERLKAELPGSQIHRWLYLARDRNRLDAARAQGPLEAAIGAYGGRMGKTVALPLIAGTHRLLAWDVALLKMLWDYLPNVADGSEQTEATR